MYLEVKSPQLLWSPATTVTASGAVPVVPRSSNQVRTFGHPRKGNQRALGMEPSGFKCSLVSVFWGSHVGTKVLPRNAFY